MFAAKPSLDGRAVVADFGELPNGLFAKSLGYLPGDIVVVTNPQTNISIEVMIFGSFDATEGIAIVLSPEAAKELYITKGSNVIVQVTKKSDAYSENTILSKTLQNYVPEKVDESEMLFEDPTFSDLLKEKVVESTEIETVIPEEEILFEEILEEEIVENLSEETVEEEIAEIIPEEILEEEVAEIIPEEILEEEVAEIIPEEILEEEVAEIIPEEILEEEIAEIIPEEILEEEVAEIIPEEILEEEIAEIIPEETLEEEIAEIIPEETLEEEFAEIIPEETLEEEVAEIIPEEILEEEFVAEMTENPLEEEIEYEETEEVALIPTEAKPPVFTIIPVPVDEEIYEEEIEDSLFIDEPEVVFVEEIDEIEEVSEDEIIPESRNIIPVEEVLEIIVEEVVSPEMEVLTTLPNNKYFIQIATYGKVENVEKLLEKYGKNYPIVVYQPSGRNDYQILIGELNKDEYGIVLERFRKAGFKDAFLRILK